MFSSMAAVFIRGLDEWRGRAPADAERGGPHRGLIFPPTMWGLLHTGHRALLERARAENDRVVLSVFVNPTQFDDPGDLQRYPRTLEADLELAGDLVDDVLPCPTSPRRSTPTTTRLTA